MWKTGEQSCVRYSFFCLRDDSCGKSLWPCSIVVPVSDASNVRRRWVGTSHNNNLIHSNLQGVVCTFQRIVYVRCVFLKIGSVDTVKEKFAADVFVQAKWREVALDTKSVVVSQPFPKHGDTFINGKENQWFFKSKNLSLKSTKAVFVWLQNEEVEFEDFDKYWNPKLYIENTMGEFKESVWYVVSHKAGKMCDTSFLWDDYSRNASGHARYCFIISYCSSWQVKRQFTRDGELKAASTKGWNWINIRLIRRWTLNYVCFSTQGLSPVSANRLWKFLFLLSLEKDQSEIQRRTSQAAPVEDRDFSWCWNTLHDCDVDFQDLTVTATTELGETEVNLLPDESEISTVNVQVKKAASKRL